MSRYRNVNNGVTVSVADDYRLDSDWEPVSDNSEGGSKYGSLKVDDLRSEIASRNEGRDEADLIPDEGKKADLIAALEADDSK